MFAVGLFLVMAVGALLAHRLGYRKGYRQGQHSAAYLFANRRSLSAPVEGQHVGTRAEFRAAAAA